VIIPDVNLLLYAEISAFAHHKAARAWWEDALNGERTIGLAPVVVFGFLRLCTNRRVFADPLPIANAIERVESWQQQPCVTCLVPGSRHFDIAFRLLTNLGTGGNLTTDVQIAAHAIEQQGEVHSNDRDFGRFEGLRWVNPLR
jgi:toxin-antitoxin system PIN domain toxin